MGGKPAINYQSVNDYLNGDKDNPTASQIIALARAFDCPPAYLLPGYNDLTALTVLDKHPETREALRLVHDLGSVGAAELLEAAREIRLRYGKDDLEVPAVPRLEESDEPPRPGRPRRRRLSFTEAAQRAVSDLEGP
ncbi:helix-turn-helix domain-containing protein [Streptomyces spiramyceticus]|uniref:helix-turn-helix domain-containing protein n=1 Tax=Streptomyces spiramyceticus TaxID=299717 RepID=UPI00237BDEA0|nr:helix-turn-helix transcriptional regulator [Streptomyces spiramyceticus]